MKFTSLFWRKPSRRSKKRRSTNTEALELRALLSGVSFELEVEDDDDHDDYEEDHDDTEEDDDKDEERYDDDFEQEDSAFEYDFDEIGEVDSGTRESSSAVFDQQDEFDSSAVENDAVEESSEIDSSVTSELVGDFDSDELDGTELAGGGVDDTAFEDDSATIDSDEGNEGPVVTDSDSSVLDEASGDTTTDENVGGNTLEIVAHVDDEGEPARALSTTLDLDSSQRQAAGSRATKLDGTSGFGINYQGQTSHGDEAFRSKNENNPESLEQPDQSELEQASRQPNGQESVVDEWVRASSRVVDYGSAALLGIGPVQLSSDAVAVVDAVFGEEFTLAAEHGSLNLSSAFALSAASVVGYLGVKEQRRRTREVIELPLT